MSTAAASHLSPAFPERAAWGTASKLRAWQADALTQYLASTPRDFLAVATPGAGKTTYALRLATELFAMGLISRVTVVAPTEHLKTQWGDAVREACEPATQRLGLTGTPFRSDTSPIPFVRYEMGKDSIRRSEADYTYGYAEALRDGVVRPVTQRLS